MEIIDLDYVFISIEAYRAWMERIRETIDDLIKRGVNLNPKEIPEEQARLEKDGSLTIFVALPTGEEVNLKVPPSHWEWRFPSN